MSELDELRAENKKLKRLLGNALELLEKTKLALTKQAQSQAGAKSTRKTAPSKRKRKTR
jgi:hypothetical protein